MQLTFENTQTFFAVWKTVEFDINSIFLFIFFINKLDSDSEVFVTVLNEQQSVFDLEIPLQTYENMTKSDFSNIAAFFKYFDLNS